MRCDACAVESSDEKAFHRAPRTFRSTSRVLCPLCREKRGVRSGWFGVGVAAAVLASPWLVPSITRPSTWMGFNLALTYAFTAVAVGIHELGHAVGGRLAGLRVMRIAIGMGRCLWRGQIAGTELLLRALPVQGQVIAIPRSKTGGGGRLFALVVAGPLANALAVVLLLPGMAYQPLIDAWGTGPAPRAAFLAANLLTLGLALFGRRVFVDGQDLPSDGIQLARIRRDPRTAWDNARLSGYLVEGSRLCEQGRYQDAQACYTAGIEQYPQQSAVFRAGLAFAAICMQDFRRARGILLEVAAERPADPGLRAAVMDNLAWADLFSGDPELLHEADESSAEAMRLRPWVPGVQETRGAVLIHQGHCEAGRELLHRAFAGTDHPQHRASCAFLLAMAEQQRGRHAEAERFGSIARRLDPACPLFRSTVFGGSAATRVQAPEPPEPLPAVPSAREQVDGRGESPADDGGRGPPWPW